MHLQAEKAVQSYKEAERLAGIEKNPQVLFMARFNLGQLYGKAKKYDEALNSYQKALELAPTSKEVKTNIELLIQQQQQGGQGGDDKKDQENKDQKDQKDKDKKDQDKKDQDKDKKDQPDKDKDKDKKDKEKEDKKYKENAKYKPRPFEGKDLSEADVKKILGELKQQEQKIRAEFNRKEQKEQPRDKDW
jgi:Ca-activated chloride channel family protein